LEFETLSGAPIFSFLSFLSFPSPGNPIDTRKKGKRNPRDPTPLIFRIFWKSSKKRKRSTDSLRFLSPSLFYITAVTMTTVKQGSAVSFWLHVNFFVRL
ncbi:unnamed protein product, partial [Linum tenue]